MKSLTITDLSLAEDLDGKAMAATRGGILIHTVTWTDWVKTLPAFPALPATPSSGSGVDPGFSPGYKPQPAYPVGAATGGYDPRLQ